MAAQIVNDLGFSFYTRSDTTGTFTTDVDYGLEHEDIHSRDKVTTININSLVLKYLLPKVIKLEIGNQRSVMAGGRVGLIEIEKKTELINVLFDIEHSGYVQGMSYYFIDSLEEAPCIIM